MPQTEDFLPEIDPRFDPLRTLDDSQSMNIYKDDDKLFVKFFTKAVMNPLASTNAGRPIFDEVDYIEIRIPGSQLTAVSAPVTDFNYMERFGNKYNHWKKENKDMISGTPIESWPYMLGKVGQVAELKAQNIHTVEQLAGIDDAWKIKIMGGQELSKRAAEWIQSTSGTDAQLSTLAAENDAMKNQLAVMQQQMAELLAQNTKAPDGADVEPPDFLRKKK
jgi:hypothetical protein